MHHRFLTGLVVVASGALLGTALRAQAPTTPPATTTTTPTTTTSAASITAGIYSADQAKRGQSVYNDSCAKCHLDDLSGGSTSPPLKGDEFLSGWKGKSVGALLDEIKMTMPFDSPGSLTGPQYADVLAYVLSVNKYPAGDKELAEDPAPLQEVKIDPPPQ